MKTYKFEVGQEYILRGGQRARVVFVDPVGCAAGVILRGDGSLANVVRWYIYGTAPVASRYDIVYLAHSWQDEIPWDAIREEFQYVAMDYSGRWFAFPNKPSPANDNIGLYWCGHRKCGLSAVHMPDSVPVPWEQTLVERPSE